MHCTSGERRGGLILLAALVGAIAHGDGFNFHLVHTPLVKADGSGHGGADINDAAAVEGAAVVHTHQAALAGGNAGDAHRAGQGQGAVGGIHAAVGELFAQGTAGVGAFVKRGLAHFAVLQGLLNVHGVVAVPVYRIGIPFEFGLRAGICRRGRLESLAPGTARAREQDGCCQQENGCVVKALHGPYVSIKA